MSNLKCFSNVSVEMISSGQPLLPGTTCMKTRTQKVSLHWTLLLLLLQTVGGPHSKTTSVRTLICNLNHTNQSSYPLPKLQQIKSKLKCEFQFYLCSWATERRQWISMQGKKSHIYQRSRCIDTVVKLILQDLNASWKCACMVQFYKRWRKKKEWEVVMNIQEDPRVV